MHLLHFQNIQGWNQIMRISKLQILESLKVWKKRFVMRCIDLSNDTIKITGIHFLYNKKKRNEKKNHESITEILLKNFSIPLLHFKSIQGWNQIMKYVKLQVLESWKVKVVVCGVKCIDLCNDTIKITRVHFSYNKEKQTKKKFLKSITKIQNVLNVWQYPVLHLKVKS